MNETHKNPHTAGNSTANHTHEINELKGYLKVITDSAFNYTILLDSDGKILYYSDRLLNMAGITDNGAFIGMHILDAYQKLFADKIHIKEATRRFSRIMTGENEFFEDDIVTWPTGEKIIYRITYKRIRNENNGFNGIVIFTMDITDIQLVEANRRINDLLHSSTLPCLICDATGHIVSYNKETLSVFGIPDGLSPDEFHDFFFSIEPEQQPDGMKTEVIWQNIIQEALKNGFSQATVRLGKADGAPLWFAVTITRIAWLFGHRLVVHYYDQTNIIKKEYEAKKAENRMELMLDASPLGCLLIGDNYEVLECNRESLKIFDVPSKKTLMDGFFHFSPRYQPDGQLSQVKAAEYMNLVHETKRVVFEWMYRDCHNAPIPTEVTLAYVKNGDDSAIVCYIRDLREYKKMMAEANEANERMQFMFNSMPLTANLVNKDFVVVDCNQECLKLFGLSSKEEYFKRFYDLAPEYQPYGTLSKTMVVKEITKAFEEGYNRVEYVHQNVNGELIPCEVILIRMKHKDDLCVLGYAWDLREIKNVLAEANEANERMRLMLNMNPLMCLMWDDKGNIIDCNQEALNILGVSDKAEFCRHFYSYFPALQPDGTKSSEKIEKIINALKNEGSINFDWTFLSQTGEQIPVESKIVRIPWKNTYYYLSFSRDLREYVRLKRDEQESRSLMNKSIAILENVDTLFFVSDLDHNLMYMNNNMAKAFGVNRDECIGKKCYKVIRNRDEICPTCKFPLLLPNKEALPTLLDEYLWDDLLGIWTESKSSIIQWVDNSLVFFHSINDRSAKKAYEDEMRKAMDASIAASAAKTTFLANMSHEIRTPMNSIIGFSELAMDDNISPKTKDHLCKIIENSTWLLQIINDILDISKIESGKMELESIPFDVHNIIARCQSVILPIASEKGLDLCVYVEPPIGKSLLGDPVRLYQALMNLLSNAVKFTKAGAVKLSSLIKTSDDNSMTIYFEVTDNGIGMSPDQMENIFDPFIQADSSTTRNYGGTGLGLAITKNIVELMGGELAVTSELGAGSTFSFELTFKTIDASDNVPGHTEINTVKKPLFDGLVLICEDNHMNQQVICEHLARVGLRTEIAENGKIGVDMVWERIKKGEKPFDLILMDMFMPVMSGIEAASTITALNTGTPIVAITANILTSELENYKKNGMSDCVGKPFTSQELWRCLLKYLTPVSVSSVNEFEENKDTDFLIKLKTNFVKNNQTKYVEISEAIHKGNITLAHRLTHTLKTNAGLIGKTGLKNTAAEVEALLKYETIPTAREMDSLKIEINAALTDLMPLLDKVTEHKNLTVEQTRTLFEKLEPMLENINPECQNLLDEIRAVSGTEELARQIEDYDFESAVRTLAEIKKNWM